MTKQSTLGTLIRDFFIKYLGQEVGSPATTVATYSIAIRLFFLFSSRCLNKSIDALDVPDIDSELVLDFLDYLENERGNLPQTRNNRLAAITTFVGYLARRDLIMVEPYTAIRAIRPKNVVDKVTAYMSKQEVEAFLGSIPRTSLSGLRDYALFSLLHNTGARVSEVANLMITDLRLDKPYHVHLTGKGNKHRIIPIWKETAEAIGSYLKARAHLQNPSLFLNNKNQPITRYGIGYLTNKYWLLAQQACPSLADIRVTPHTFRHTCAFQHAESGNDITVTQDLLGHANLETTRQYFHLSRERMQKALEMVAPPAQAPDEAIPKWQQPHILQFLTGLSRSHSHDQIPTSLRAPPRASPKLSG